MTRANAKDKRRWEQALKVELLRNPTDDDWRRCRELAYITAGRNASSEPVSDGWKRMMLRAGHSPIRTLMFTIRMEIPYWVSVHFVRHKIGVEHYVTSQRNDRQDRYDRNQAPQSEQVAHVMDINAQALINMAGMRLCNKAAVETQMVMTEIRDAVVQANPEFADFLAPKCHFMRECNEPRPCGRMGKQGLRQGEWRDADEQA